MALKGRRALFISYNGMLEPLGKSQVIPYLSELAGEGVVFTLLSFERPAAFTPSGRAQCHALKMQLAASNIDWHWLRYHKRFSVPATAYDVLNGIRYTSRLVKIKRIELVHARSHIPATIALALKRRFSLRMIFDVRGLMAEEYVDARHWQERNVSYRFTKSLERRAFSAADGVVTLTQRIWPVISEWNGLRDRHVAHQVVPCCVDLKLFRFRHDDRVRRRAELRLDNRFLLTYSGSIGGWYSTAEMIDFYMHLLKHRSDAHFLWLTAGDQKMINQLMEDRGINHDRYTVLSVAAAEVPSYLSASDAGIAFYKPTLSRLATSPVKVSEYFACGLPAIINTGIGDLEALLRQERVGALAQGFTVDDYQKAIAEIQPLISNASETRQRARSVAEKYFNVHRIGRERYTRLYEEVLGS